MQVDQSVDHYTFILEGFYNSMRYKMIKQLEPEAQNLMMLSYTLLTLVIIKTGRAFQIIMVDPL